MKGTGKTTFLDFLRLLSFNAFKERSTLATFRDKTDSERATALIDQADNKFGTDERKISDMLDPIVDSYKSTSGVMSKSVQKGKNFERVEYDIFSPKVFASIKDLNFDLKDRCIQIQLVKSTENKPQLDSDKQIWFEMRNELYKMLILYFKSVKNISIETEAKYLESKTLFGRPKELWLPIETILKLCNLNESEITKILNSYIQKIAITEDSLNELESEVIKFIWKQFVVEEEKWIPLKDIANDPTVIEMFDDEKILSLKSRTNIIGGLLKRLNIYNDRKRKNGGYIHFYTKDRVQKFLKAYSVVEDSDSQYSQFAEIPVDSSEF
jgi:sporulation protein YlmC with PRC-barrel domain